MRWEQDKQFSVTDSFCTFLEKHPALRSLTLGRIEFSTLKTSSPTLAAHRNITSLSLEGSKKSWTPVTVKRSLDCFVSLREFSISNIRFISSDCSNLPARVNVLRVNDDNSDSSDQEQAQRPQARRPITFRQAVIPANTLQARRTRIEPAGRPTKITFCTSKHPWDSTDGPIASLALLNDIAGGTIEHFCVLAEFPVVLYGDFSELRVLELELFTGKVKRPQGNQRWAIAKGRIPLVFHGFNAPKLEKIIVHGDEIKFKAKEIREVVGEDVEVVVTGEPRPAMLWSEIEWSDYMM